MKKRTLILLSFVCLVGCVPPLPLGTEKTLLSFAFDAPSTIGEIDQQSHSVRLAVPAETDPSSLVALFTFTGATVRVGDVEQQSGLTVNDFTNPVAYVVAAEDGSSQTYTVSVVPPLPLCADKTFTSFALLAPAATGQIDETLHTVRLSVPAGTDLARLTATFVTTGVLVTVQDVPQESGVTMNDFTEPTEFVVTAQDGTTEMYVVTVTALPSTEKSLTQFAFDSTLSASAIDQETHIVRVRVSPGTDLTSLRACFATTGTCVRVGGEKQESGVTRNDFTRPVPYVVWAEDGSVATYEVRVMARIPLVLNELDVDQVGTDAAEFIEILAAADVDLQGIFVVLLNGGVTPGQEYGRIDLSRLGMISSGTYLVIAGPNVSVAAGGLHFTPAGWESSNRIQNGPNDAIMLWDSIGKCVIDTVSYNGSLHRALLTGDPTEWDATEGNAGAPADSNTVTGSLSRLPDGHDTGQSSLDFRFTPAMSPGAPNG